ncbi:MAG: ribonuclease H-like domain-containing protein [Nitrospinae bacterium]|nr:ribonuclease H-like domain-containing protein [Nitrospinota bacterium]
MPGYGLKKICKHSDLVNFQWEEDDSGSQWSVVQYINFLRSENPEERKMIKDSILGYNRDDVMATQKLEEWLRLQ